MLVSSIDMYARSLDPTVWFLFIAHDLHLLLHGYLVVWLATAITTESFALNNLLQQLYGIFYAEAVLFFVVQGAVRPEHADVL